ncbi:hypothetical protein YK48G_19690 [Lentilactobacillus fungorum]|uniref:Uncharacterized protein n=1 Tax=Lentilactobacillus fungorum TaxID=2201250 RepID=A0ABQ3W514_9LACO|nr:DUF6681 family protein [Lentilactobacillus fungorum]GHP14544.1 hypothetical protein YK48G_19690 [Lentilactobacillus fungorum]
MFSFLDMINHYLGYFNINVKLKSRIYTILGALGVLYLIYISFRFLKNGYLKQGSLILAVAIILLYFTVCNFFYYFTKHQPWFDISPKLAKWLHIQEHTQETQVNSKMGSTVIQEPRNNIAANGLFDDQHLLPAKIEVTASEQQNINRLAAQMEHEGLFRSDYDGLDDRKLYELLKVNDGNPIYAIGKGMTLPYFEMRQQGLSLIVYCGMNQAEVFPVGEIKRVGLQSVRSLDLSELKLYLASVTLVGGAYKQVGRASVIEEQQPYTVRAMVAYKRK